MISSLTIRVNMHRISAKDVAIGDRLTIVMGTEDAHDTIEGSASSDRGIHLVRMNRRLLDMLAGWMNHLCHDIEHAEQHEIPGVTSAELDAELDLVHDLYQAAGQLEDPTEDKVAEFVIKEVIPVLINEAVSTEKSLIWLNEALGAAFTQRLRYAIGALQPLTTAESAALADGPEISGGIDVEPVDIDDLSDEARQGLEAGLASAKRGEIVEWDTDFTQYIERHEWRELAGALRNQESRIQGIIADVNWDSPEQISEALKAIDELVNGPRTEGGEECWEW